MSAGLLESSNDHGLHAFRSCSAWAGQCVSSDTSGHAYHVFVVAAAVGKFVPVSRYPKESLLSHSYRSLMASVALTASHPDLPDALDLHFLRSLPCLNLP